ncbi:MAG: hypothetical protein PHE36_03880 [Novosphingobium sp.]|nr:hypothetical protein [Novosphingobium sp.]
MRSIRYGILCAATAMVLAPPAFAASDYFLVIDGVDGEASSATQVESWSWGQTNSGGSVPPNIGSSGQDGVAARDNSPKVTASQNTQSLRESPSRPHISPSQNSQSLRESPTRLGGGLTASQNSQELRQADFANLAQLGEVSDFTLNLGSDAVVRQMCGSGKHIARAHLVRADGTVYDLTDLVIGSCDTSGGATVVKIVSGKAKEFKGHVTLLK